jgi:hypothetical protein
MLTKCYTKNFIRKHEERDLLEDLGIDERIILEWEDVEGISLAHDLSQ